MTLTIKSPALYATLEQWLNDDPARDDSQILQPGETVQYVAHIPGGMVKVRRDGQEVVIHPGCTDTPA